MATSPAANTPQAHSAPPRSCGGAFGWIGPMAYWLVTEGALAGSWTTPWEWPTRPPHDLGGALCAYGVFAAGLVAITLLGARDPSRHPASE